MLRKLTPYPLSRPLKMKLFVSVFPVFLLVFQTLIAQTNNSVGQEEVEIEIKEIGKYFKIGKKAKALKKIQNITNLLVTVADKEYHAEVYYDIGNILLNNSQFDQSDSILNIASAHTADQSTLAKIYLLKFTNDIRRGIPADGDQDLLMVRKAIGKDTTGVLMLKYYTSSGVSNLYKGDNLKALGFFLKAKELEKATESPHSFVLNHNLASIYEGINAYEESLQLANENAQKAAEQKKYKWLLYSYFTIMTNDYYLGNYDNVNEIFLKALQLKKERNISQAFGYIYFNQGMALVEKEELDSAIHIFHIGLKISEKQNERKEQSDNYRGLAYAYLKKKEYQKAAHYAEKSKSYDLYFDEEVRGYSADIYASLGDYEKAYSNLKHIFEYQEKEAKENKTNKILTSLIIANQEQERKQQQLLFKNELDKQQAFYIQSTLCFGLLILFYFLYTQRKNTKRLQRLNMELEQRNSDLKQFAYITSHDLKEPIRNIRSFTGLIDRMLQKNTIDLGLAKEYLDYIKNSGQTLSEIINALSIYTKVSNDEINFESTLLSEAFKKTEQNVSQLIKDKNGQLEFEKEQGIEEVYFSPAMLSETN